MKSLQSKSDTAARASHTAFFGKESRQAFFGNDNQTSFFNHNSVQAKLTVNQPGDKYEQEADAVADKVVQRLSTPDVLTKEDTTIQAKPLVTTISPFIQSKCAECEKEDNVQKKEEELAEKSFIDLQEKPIFESTLEAPKEEENVQLKCAECEEDDQLQKKEEEELSEELPPELQEKPIFESDTETTGDDKHVQQKKENIQAKTELSAPVISSTGIENNPPLSTPVPVVQAKCNTCEQEDKLQKKEDEELQQSPRELQKKPIFESNAEPPEDENNVQAKATSPATSPATTGIESHLNSSKGTGSPLPDSTKAQMENSFGTDFSSVRIHNDSSAVQMSKDLNAQAFTHGSDIYFNEGKYNTTSQTGQHLLAHELTHTVQQGGSNTKRKTDDLNTGAQETGGFFEEEQTVQAKPQELVNYNSNAPGIQRLAFLIPIVGRMVVGYLVEEGVRWGIRKIFDDAKPVKDILEDVLRELREMPVDIKGMAFFNPSPIIKDYIQSYHYASEFFKTQLLFPDLAKEYAKGPKVNFQYGGMGHVGGVNVRWNAATDTYEAGPFQMALVHDDFNFFDKREKTLGLNVTIKNSVISGKVGVAPLADFFTTLSQSTRHETPTEFVFDPKLLEEALLGKDAEKATTLYTQGDLTGGFIDLVYTGYADIGNLQSIDASYILRDGLNKDEWQASSDLDVMGMKPFRLNILRTAKGILSGIMAEGEKILFAASIEEKGFKAGTEVKASYLNQTLIIQGTGFFETDRAKGDLFFMVTDYTTAKNHALNFLTDLEASGPIEEGPPNPGEQLAFMASGNLTITLFNGARESRSKKIADKFKETLMEDPKPGKTSIPALQAEASFVVEPEGYITVSGLIKPLQESFDLTARQEYEKIVPLGDVPLGQIPLPYGFNLDFDFTAKAFAKAFLEPLRLSDIYADGVFSTNPRIANEINLGAKLSISGGVSVGIKFCLNISVGALGGLISVTLIEKCIEGAVGVSGGIVAEPTIQIKKSPPADKDQEPPEYYIKGNMHLSAGGAIQARLGDTLAIKVEDKEQEEDKGKKPLKTWHYKNKEIEKTKTFGNSDAVAPMDLTLGSGEPPPVASPPFSRKGLWVVLESLLGGRKKKVDEYFKEVPSTDPDPTKPKGPDEVKDPGFSGVYEEKGEQLNDLEKPGKKEDEETTYTFEEAFTMLTNAHKLILNVTQSRTAGKVKVDSILIMESEAEPMKEKIEEEKKEIDKSVNDDKTFRQTDLAAIEKQADQVTQDVNKLGVDEQLTSNTNIAGLKETATATSKYAKRYHESDLGTPEDVPDPKCPKPKLNPKDDVYFETRKDNNKLGEVIEVKENPIENSNGQTIGKIWAIVFRPKNRRTTSSLMNDAYDADCNPLFEKRDPKGCEGISPQPPLTHHVPARTINGVTYPAKNKAWKVEMYPLCWSAYQGPKDDKVIGWVRIKDGYRKSWHRMHLIHGMMGGPGVDWNLVPAPQIVNNGEMKTKVENPLLNLVISGLATGISYWFKAEVFYYDNTNNAVIGHFDDFVKEVKVQYGVATKDADNKWKLDPPIASVTIDQGFIDEPDSNEINPGRIKG